MSTVFSLLVIDDADDAHARWRALLDEAGLCCRLETAGRERLSSIAGSDHDVVVIEQSAGTPLAEADLPPAPAVVVITPDHDPRSAPSSVHRIPRAAVHPHTVGPLLRAAVAQSSALAALREAECRVRSHFESLPHPAYVWRATADDDFRLIDVNEAAHALTRGRIRAMAGRRATEFFSHRPDIVATMRRCRDEKRPIRREGPYLMRTTGEELYLDTTYAFVPPDVVVGHTEDKTGRRRAESDAAERERQFQALFDRAKDAILVADDDARYVDGNPAALALLDVTREQLRAMRVQDVVVADGVDGHEAWQRFLREGAQDGRLSMRRRDGTLRTVDFSATANFTPGRHLAILRDVTEREELERELQQAQRLDGIGRLAGGIAHDFNNLLTAIIGFADLLLLTFPEDDSRRADVGEIHRAAESAAGLIRQLLAFGRKQVLQPVALDVNAHIAGVTSLLRRLLGDAIDVRTVFRTPRLRVSADPSQLEQIILNLAINAREAMPGGGRLSITTERTIVPPGTAREGTTVNPGDYARIVVTDTGQGMTADTMAHIFEPFYTTKLQTNGTGLGLATVYGIVKQSGGYIWVSSQEGAGTSFELLLPALAPAAPRRARRRRRAAGAPRGTILVVDDDRAIRTLASRALSQKGFRVVEAAGAADALTVLRQTDVALLLTDVVMPGLNGIELAAQVRQAYPAVKVLFMSGFAADAVARCGELPADSEVLVKPFTPDLLLACVARALADGAAATSSEAAVDGRAAAR